MAFRVFADLSSKCATFGHRVACLSEAPSGLDAFKILKPRLKLAEAWAMFPRPFGPPEMSKLQCPEGAKEVSPGLNGAKISVEGSRGDRANRDDSPTFGEAACPELSLSSRHLRLTPQLTLIDTDN